MGQHLHLYASKALSVAQAEKWCHARAFELSELPAVADQPVVDRVRLEMDRLSQTQDHLEHWSNWVGVQIWDFLVWTPHIVDQALIDRAVAAAREAMNSHPGVRARYRETDFTADDVIAFLNARRGYVVWGDNDGI